MTIRSQGDWQADALRKQFEKAWEVMDKAVLEENEHGDVHMAIQDWQELCELVMQGKKGGSP